jgi:hypothetical protein
MLAALQCVSTPILSHYHMGSSSHGEYRLLVANDEERMEIVWYS